MVVIQAGLGGGSRLRVGNQALNIVSCDARRLLKIWGLVSRSGIGAIPTGSLFVLMVDDVPQPIKFEVATLEKHVL